MGPREKNLVPLFTRIFGPPPARDKDGPFPIMRGPPTYIYYWAKAVFANAFKFGECFMFFYDFLAGGNLTSYF